MTPTKRRGNRVIEAERQMACTGGCGVVRVETYVITNDSRVVRDGKPRYRYTKPFLLKRDTLPPGEARATVDRDHLRMLTFARMFPALKW